MNLLAIKKDSSFGLASLENWDNQIVSHEHKKLLRGFNCGVDSLDEFLRLHAIYYGEIGEGKTTVYIDDNVDKIIGYHTLKCSSIKINQPEMSENDRILPAIEIARLAIDRRYQKRWIGADILTLAISDINDIKNKFAGVMAITLFAHPKAVGFYEKFGFEVMDNTMEIYRCYKDEGCICMYNMSYLRGDLQKLSVE